MYICLMIFITGGTGLVGSHILLKLAQQGQIFKALKRPSSSLEVCKNVFKYYDATDLFYKINWLDGDINDIPSLVILSVSPALVIPLGEADLNV